MTVWVFDSQDMRTEPSGFQGRFTRVRGVTNRDFPTREAAELAIKQAKDWRLMGFDVAGFDAVYRHRTAKWFLCLQRESR